MLSPYLSTTEAAKELGVTKHQVCSLAQEGKLIRPHGINRGYYTRESVMLYKVTRKKPGEART